MTETRAPQGRRALALSFLSLLAVVALLFGQAASFPFLRWDDLHYIVRNPLVRDPLARGWSALLLTPDAGYPQPVTLLTQHLDVLWGGGQAWSFHVTNVALHGLNTVLCLLLLRGLRLSSLAAFGGALLFAIHPLVAEPVCWATGRKDLLVVFFVLAGLLAGRAWLRAATRRQRWGFGALLTLCCLGALGSKPLGVVLPLLLLVDGWALQLRPHRFQWALWGLLVALSVGVIGVSLHTQRQHGALRQSAPSLERRVRFASQHLALQLRHVVWPRRLAPKYLERLPRPLLSLWGLSGLFVALFFLAALGLAVWRKHPLALWGLAWLGISFAPASGLIPLNRGPADVYMYLPLIGVAALVAGGFQWVRSRWPRPATILALTGVVALALPAFLQARIWRSNATMWAPLIHRYPHQRVSWWNYAEALALEGKLPQAIAVYERGLRHFPYPPRHPAALESLGNACMAIRAACSTRWYGEVLRHYPLRADRALRMLAATAQHSLPAYQKEHRLADNHVRKKLRQLQALPAAQKPKALRAFVRRHLAGRSIAIAGLRTLRQDAALGPTVQALLQLLHRRPLPR